MTKVTLELTEEQVDAMHEVFEAAAFEALERVKGVMVNAVSLTASGPALIEDDLAHLEAETRHLHVIATLWLLFEKAPPRGSGSE